MGAAFAAEQEGVALGVVARALGGGSHLDETAVGILAMAGRDALGDDCGARIGREMNHLGAGVGLLVVARDGHGIEFAGCAAACKDAGWVFPGDGRAGLDLGPGEFGIVAAAEAALGDKIVDASAALLVAGVPVLYGGIFHLGAVFDHDFDDGGMELVFVAHGCGASLEV